MIRLFGAAFLVLTGCAAPLSPIGPTRAITIDSADLPPIRTFQTTPSPAPVSRSNISIAQDFMDLSFRMESGRKVPVLTRFEDPITVSLIGNARATTISDLDALLERMRREADLDIRRTTSANASVIIEIVPRNVLQRAVPRAACLVVPRVNGWTDYLAARGTARIDWTTLTTRDRVAIFLPDDVSPQETRDCLHEELAQAIGPLNDLYRLSDSVFNDDNTHSVLTSFDMLILKTYYDRDLANGMNAQQVASRLPAILGRLNSQMAIPAAPPSATPPEWVSAIRKANSTDLPQQRRIAAARRAVVIGQTRGWTDTRQGFAYYILGRLLVESDAPQARTLFAASTALYDRDPSTRIHAARVAIQEAAFALRDGDFDRTLAIAARAEPVARERQNAALLATLMMLKAEALEQQGNVTAADVVRLDSIGWARYGFGEEAFVSARLADISGLRP